MSPAERPDPGATTFSSFLEALSARTPTPAGGAAAGLAAASGAALLAMVARYTTDGRFGEVEAEMRGLAAEADELARHALETIRADEEAFGAVAGAYELPRETEGERARRAKAVQEAMGPATVPPMRLAAMCVRLAELARVLADRGNPNVVSDVATGAACVAAASDGCLVNLQANAAVVRDEAVKISVKRAVDGLVPHRDALRALVDEVRDRYGRT